VAAKLLNELLKDDFGFENCLWVFSGRRGVHCWICDPEARNMTNEMRSSITTYYELARGNENSDKLKLQFPLHPMLRKSFNILRPYFEKIVIED
jgi:DNA primase small subunit